MCFYKGSDAERIIADGKFLRTLMHYLQFFFYIFVLPENLGGVLRKNRAEMILLEPDAVNAAGGNK